MGQVSSEGSEWGGRDPDKPLGYDTTMDRVRLTEWASTNPNLPEDPGARAAKIKEDVDFVIDLGYSYEQWMKIEGNKSEPNEEGEE